MKRALTAILALGLCFTIATLLTATTKGLGYSESYPAVVCPPTLSGLSSQISLSSRKTQYQRLQAASTKTIPFNALRFPIAKDVVVVSAKGVTPVVWQSRAGSWAGGAICSGPASSQWFVGASSDVTTRGRLIVINSGLSEAIVDVQTFSENGKQPQLSINLKAKSYSLLKLDALATGDKSLTVQVVARSGRINTFMIDELGAGLKSLGGDFVNPINTASTTLVIPAIPNQPPKKGQKTQSSHTLRILTPSQAGANFTLELISSDGSFVPVGFGSRNISAGIVSEFSISPRISSKSFAVRIQSDEPIVAAVISTVTVNNRRDFVWSTPTPALVPMAMAVTGLAPVIVFTSDSIAVKVEMTLVNGKKVLTTIKGSNIATWRVPDAVRSFAILKTSDNTFAGALVASENGYGFLPITPGSILTRVEVPRANIRVLNP